MEISKSSETIFVCQSRRQRTFLLYLSTNSEFKGHFVVILAKKIIKIEHRINSHAEFDQLLKHLISENYLKSWSPAISTANF